MAGFSAVASSEVDLFGELGEHITATAICNEGVV